MASMKTVLVTGASGFLGLNLIEAMRRSSKWAVRTFDRTQPIDALHMALAGVDRVCHLESLYRTADGQNFHDVNVGLTSAMTAHLLRTGSAPPVVYASSTQASADSDYGRSKFGAEEVLRAYSQASGASVALMRLPNEFGKWCKPDDNSVVATFCHRLARGQEIAVNDPTHVLNLAYIDDIVATIIEALEHPPVGTAFVSVGPVRPLTVGELAQRLRGFSESRTSLVIQDCADPLQRALYATYLSYLDGADFAYSLQKRDDPRGSLAEYFKNDHFGQVFVSRTRAGITRGHHYHDTKVEKFCVLDGEALIRFVHLVTGAVVSHRVRGDEFTVVDIPPGYAHSIENVGASDLVVLFWANEIFDPTRPDTHPREVPSA